MRSIGLKIIMVAACLGLFLPGALAAQGAEDETYYPFKFARLNYVSGDVFIQRTGDLGYEKGEINLVLVEGDSLGTGDGRAEVRFGRRNTVRIDANGKIEFAGLPDGTDDPVKLHILEGRIYVRIENLNFEKAVEVHTPDASFYVLDAGLYRFDIDPGGRTSVSAIEGELEAASESGSVVLGPGEMLAASDGRFLGDPESGRLSSDDFAEWNDSREALFARRSTRTHLPADLDEYEDELDDNGRWVNENPYGYVWVPSVTQSDWRPYMMGRWAWYPVIGWTWVSSEPWGWSVYHYGRWHWRGGLGWYWIPRNEWGPAWVNWWWDGDYVGWCPLSWYNRPAVLVHNAFYDRHYGRDFPIDNRAMTVIRRDGLRGRIDNRHVVQPSELRHLGKISLRAEQPGGMRPATSIGGADAERAKRIFRSGPGRADGVQPRSGMDRNSLGSRSGTVRTWPSDRPGVSRDVSIGRTTAPGGSAAGRLGGSNTTGRPGSSRGNISQRGTVYPSRLSPGSSGRNTVGGSGARGIRSYPSGRVDGRSGDVQRNVGSGNRPRTTTSPDPTVKDRKQSPRGEGNGNSAVGTKKREEGSSGRVKSNDKVKKYSSSYGSNSGPGIGRSSAGPGREGATRSYRADNSKSASRGTMNSPRDNSGVRNSNRSSFRMPSAGPSGSFRSGPSSSSRSFRAPSSRDSGRSMGQARGGASRSVSSGSSGVRPRSSSGSSSGRKAVSSGPSSGGGKSGGVKRKG